MVKAHRESSPAWEKSLSTNPVYLKNLLKSLTERAGSGDEAAAGDLARLLTDHPDLKSAVRELDDLMTKAEGAWVRAVGGGDQLAERAAQDEVSAMKAELLGPGAGVLEKILVSAVVVSHVSYQHAAAVAALKTDVPAVAAMRDKRLSSALKRLLAAVKGWQIITGRKAKGLAPRPAVRLFEPVGEAVPVTAGRRGSGRRRPTNRGRRAPG
jgi:hypothetical protein